MEPDRAVLSMPFADSLPTIDEVVHGGAISSLVDTAAAAAAWSGTEAPEHPRASTSITVDFLRPARAQGLRADARLSGEAAAAYASARSRSRPADGTPVATTLVTYQL